MGLMMARVNVDTQALSDARFMVLSNLMGYDDPDYAIGKLVRVWAQCIERETYEITKQVIVALFRGETRAPEWLVNAELAEDKGAVLRIKGTKGRIEYLAEKRKNARKNGKLGGRPKKPTRKPTLVSNGNQHRTDAETPPAPAPAPAQEDNKNPLYPPLPFSSDEFAAAWYDWQQHRREKKSKLTATAIKKQFKLLSEIGELRALAAIEFSIAQGYTGIFEPNGKRPQNSLGDEIKNNGQAFLDMTGGAQ